MNSKERRLEKELQKAITRGDLARIGELVDFLRFCRRASYSDCYRVAHRLTGISLGDWDELLYRVDQNEED